MTFASFHDLFSLKITDGRLSRDSNAPVPCLAESKNPGEFSTGSQLFLNFKALNNRLKESFQESEKFPSKDYWSFKILKNSWLLVKNSAGFVQSARHVTSVPQILIKAWRVMTSSCEIFPATCNKKSRNWRNQGVY